MVDHCADEVVLARAVEMRNVRRVISLSPEWCAASPEVGRIGGCCGRLSVYACGDRSMKKDLRIISRSTLEVSSSLTMSMENLAELLNGRSNGWPGCGPA
jgi:hypothetical protein